MQHTIPGYTFEHKTGVFYVKLQFAIAMMLMF